jgi:hypothetical protein
MSKGFDVGATETIFIEGTDGTAGTYDPIGAAIGAGAYDPTGAGIIIGAGFGAADSLTDPDDGMAPICE